MWRPLGLLVVWAACKYSPPVASGDGPPPDGDPPIDMPMTDGGERVTAGLIGLWQLNDLGGSGGNIVADSANVAPPVSPTVANPGSVTWSAGGMTINAVGDINTGFTGVENRLMLTCKLTDAATVEAWVTPANATQIGTLSGHPARIVTFGPMNSGNHDIGLGQMGPNWVAQVHTTNVGTDQQGLPFMMAPVVVTLTHLVVTVDTTSRKFFVNGTLVASDALGGMLTPWDRFHAMSVGGDPLNRNTWLGTVHFMAMYDRALSDTEVQTNFLVPP